MHVEIRLSQESELNAIMKALIPDNINFPKGLSMKIFSQDNVLVLDALSKTGIYTLLNTIDEVLEHISIAKKVIDDA
ncbi:MAG: hypothetical protein M3219_02730 [Thermoproteota archaeon]|nr:hypothetical protein [Thermoproteota archaeon]